MLYGIEGILNGKLFGNGGSSGGSGGDSGGGGVGVAPMIDHGFGYATFQFGSAKTIPAGGSITTNAGHYSSKNLTNGSSGTLYGYFYGHPEITAEVILGNKAVFENIWNSSATDFVFDQTWTDYIFVPLYHAT